jgi:hypothetical protein
MCLCPYRKVGPHPRGGIAMSNTWYTDRVSGRHMNPLGRLHYFRGVSLKASEEPLRSRQQTV